MRLTPTERSLIGKVVDRLGNKSLVAKAFGIARKTVYKWNRRRKHTNDRKRRKKKSKVTVKVELSILAMRNFFEWGTERIQKGLHCLPKFMRDTLKKLKVDVAKHISLSRTTINDVLRKHKLDGYKRKQEGWKFFRAKKPNELWQLDIKGPFKVGGKRYWFVICIDDFSRYAILAEQCNHAPTIKEIGKMLKPLIRKYRPKKILTDNNPFKEEWDKWCKENGVESIHAHPYYPQDKGKVERAIRNFAEEFVYLLTKFPQWLKGKIKEYQKWHNNKRINRGINAIPCQLFT